MRLLPFETSNGGLGIEGAGPTGGFFRVLANPDHPFEEEATEGGRWSQLGIAEVWGAADNPDGSWQWNPGSGMRPVSASAEAALEQCYQAGQQGIVQLPISGINVQFLVDPHQMKMTALMQGFSIALQRSVTIRPLL